MWVWGGGNMWCGEEGICGCERREYVSVDA